MRPSNPEEKRKKTSSSLLKIIAKGSILTFFGTLIGKGLFFSIRVVITRIFGAEYFGLLAIGIIVIEFAVMFALIGLAHGGMRFVSVAIGSRRFDKISGIFGTVIIIPLLFSLLISIVLFSFPEIISDLWFKNTKLIPILQLLALGIPFATIVKAGVNLSRGFNTTKYAVFVENIFVPLISVIVFFFFYFLGAHFDSIIYAIVISYLLGAVLVLFFLRKQLHDLMKTSLNNLAFLKGCLVSRDSLEIINYSIPLFLTGFAVISLNSIDIVMIGYFLDAKYVGIYAAASMFAVFISSLLVMSLNSIFAPLVATQHGKNATDTIRHIYITTTRWMFYISVPLVISFIIAREQLMLVFGKEFIIDGPTILFILLIGHMVNCLTGGVGQIMTMTGHQKKELSINVIAVMLNIGLNLFLIPKFGIIGAAVATSATQIIVNLSRVFVVYKILDVQPFTIKLLKYLLIGIGVVALSFIARIYFPVGKYDLAFAALSIFVMIAAIFTLKLEKEDGEFLKTLPVIRLLF